MVRKENEVEWGTDWPQENRTLPLERKKILQLFAISLFLWWYNPSSTFLVLEESLALPWPRDKSYTQISTCNSYKRGLFSISLGISSHCVPYCCVILFWLTSPCASGLWNTVELLFPSFSWKTSFPVMWGTESQSLSGSTTCKCIQWC